MALLAWDQGSEMAAHKAFTIATGIPVHLCDPASPWQRGSNEDTNGLLLLRPLEFPPTGAGAVRRPCAGRA